MWRKTRKGRREKQGQCISIHFLHVEEDDYGISKKRYKELFQSTSSMWRKTHFYPPSVRDYQISIHFLHVEEDEL